MSKLLVELMFWEDFLSSIIQAGTDVKEMQQIKPHLGGWREGVGGGVDVLLVGHGKFKKRCICDSA